MKIFWLRRTDSCDYDEYDSFVVCANSPEEAKKIARDKAGPYWSLEAECTHIGDALPFVSSGVIVGSFNAG